MSDGRKIFRFLKYLPEAAKSKNALYRSFGESGLTATRSLVECVARAVSCFYYFLDNMLWFHTVRQPRTKQDLNFQSGRAWEQRHLPDDALMAAIGGHPPSFLDWFGFLSLV